jgi:alpha-glucosidase (family GH31 glycosyl hydrolase)
MSHFGRLTVFAFAILFFALRVFSQVYLGDYTGHTVEGRSVTVHAGSSSVRFIFYQPEIVRVDYLPAPGTMPDSTFVVVQDTGQTAVPSVTELDSMLLIASSSMTVRCSRYPVRLAFSDGSGAELLAEPAEGGLATIGSARVANFLLDPQEHFYGTGERGIGLDLRGNSFESYNTQTYGYNGALATMNINIPFLSSSRGYALLFDNTYTGHFDLGAGDPGRFSYRAGGGELTFYMIAGSTVPRQLELYTWLTGRQPLPPRWALGYLQSKYGYRNETEARAMVDTMRAKNIPCDAIIIDGYWFSDMGDLAWNTDAWPDPFGMMSDFRNDGFKTIVISQTYITSPSASWGEAVMGGFLGLSPSGNPYILPNWWSCGCDAGLLDITHPEAREWFWGKHPGFFGNELAGIWTDLGEPERHPLDMQHVLGSTAKVHNIYNLLWAETDFNGFNNFRPDQRLFNLTRSGFAGIQRYGVATWSGDVAKSFSALAVQLPMLLNMGMSGIGYHNSDIGGFCCGTTTAELYVRWMQFGTFCPVARAHGAGPAVGGQDTEPWVFGAAAEEICRDYIRFRYQLLPYLYTLARENHDTGMPLVRPLFFADPEDPALYDNSASYLLGDALLVSPVVQAGQTTKDVYLPSGSWVYLWDDRLYGGGGMVTVSTPLETMPVFVKRGSIIPRQPVMNYSDERPADTLMVSVYPSPVGAGGFTLYEDDGETLEYQSGSFARIPLAQQTTATGVLTSLSLSIGAAEGTYAGMPERRAYLADVHGIAGGPTAAFINGRPIAQRSSYEELREGGDGFFFDPSAGILYLQAGTVPDSAYVIVAEGLVLSAHIDESVTPDYHTLFQNYPNPFNSSTTIRYQLSTLSPISITIFDLLGRQVATLVNGKQEPGAYTVQWDAAGVPSGVYFYRLTTPSFSQTKKLLLLR